jgi:hypothetical protein
MITATTAIDELGSARRKGTITSRRQAWTKRNDINASYDEDELEHEG